MKLYISIIASLFITIAGLSQNVIVPEIIRSCYVDSLLVDAGPGYNQYLWSNGDTTQSTWINETGDYSITVTDTIETSEDFHVLILDAYVTQSDTSIKCADTIMLKGSDFYYDYFWLPDVLEEDSIFVFPRESTLYYAQISDPDSSEVYCIDSVKVNVETILLMDTVMQLGMGCPGEKKAKIQVGVSGGYPPYQYDWPAEAIVLFEDPSFAIGLTDGTKNITVTDSIGCFLNYEFEVKAFPIPELELYADPKDTVYIQKPYITFSYENPVYDSTGADTFYVESWVWNFGDSLKSTLSNPTHTYKKAKQYTVVLNYTTFLGCNSKDTIVVVVKPIDLSVPMAITPNGDNSNDKFVIFESSSSGGGGSGGSTAFKAVGDDVIDLNEYFLSNTLIIFNRWGEKVYEKENYENDWDGGGLQDGTYFYIFRTIGEFETRDYKGSFMIFNGAP
ncbi:MAG: gliding motility-associated C-terminal domain-containing protein [Bacteroidales bacterium]|nr:gliding motility-associated C-terminal domain-containing protein [Bacteroidales bacterium]MCF8405928.1 gliding motility-associated C-terminal domain-containing protein [Bacteroidales bacterium]